MTKTLLILCSLALLSLSFYYFRHGRAIHALADLLFALGLLGVALFSPHV